MTKLLIKKQLQEIFKQYFYDAKKNKARSKFETILYFLGFCLLMFGFLGIMFGFIANSICEPLHSANMDWLYFLLMAIMTVALGIFGTVFTTYSTLYLANDNDITLSLPIPIKSILASRVFATYVMTFMYSIIVFLPAIIVYYSKYYNDRIFISSLLFYLQLSVFILTLSCALGYVVAKISVKLKNKSFVTVLASLLFIGLYYFLYFKASAALRDITVNVAVYGKILHDKAYFIYMIGQACAGNFLYLLIISLISVALFIPVWILLNKSFLKVTSAASQSTKVKVKKFEIKQSGVFQALVKKELLRFTNSATYMLNSGLGIVFMLLFTGAVIIKKDLIYSILPSLSGQSVNMVMLLVFFFIIPMNYMGACSISLEGKNLWLSKSLPVTSKEILLAKVTFQGLLTVVPSFVCALIITIVLKANPLVILNIIACCVFFSIVDVALNVRFPSLTWTNEITVIKQSGCSMLALIGGWLYPVIFMGLYLLLKDMGIIYFLMWLVITIVVTFLVYYWLIDKGAKRYEEL